MTMNRRPLVWFAVSWTAGSAAAAGLGSRGAMFAAGAAILLALAAVLCRQASWRLAAVCLVALVLAAGERVWTDARNVTALPDVLAAASADEPRATVAAEVSGIIVSAVEVDGDRAMLRLAADSVRIGDEAAPRQIRERFMVHIRLEQQPEQQIAAAWQRGDRIRVAGELSRPATATNSGGFDYRRYLGSQRIHWLLQAKGTAAAQTAAGPGWSAAAMLGRVDAARAWLGARMERLYPADQSGYMKGLVLGIREDLDPRQFQQFSRLGLTHILAISGLHVAVFMYALSTMLRFVRMTRERILLTLMFAVPMYVLISGASPSVIRAGIMAVLGLIAARMGKLKDGLHLLAAAAVGMLIIDPYYLNDVSFQLSFIVTLGLIAGVPPVRRAMPQWKRGKALLDLAAVTVVAQFVSFPLTIYYFNQFHILSLLANFMLVPFISSIVLPIGAIALVIAIPWEWGGKMLAAASHYANQWTFAIVEKLAVFDSLRMIWGTPPLWWVFAWLLLLGFGFRVLDRWISYRKSDASGPSRFKLPFSALVFFMGLLLYYGYTPDRLDSSATVSVLDVGQGDSIVIRTPSGKHILIDGGGTYSFRKPGEEWKDRSDPFEVGRKVVVPLLMKRGIRQIDLLVVSHLDGDHIRGLEAVIENIPVRRIWWNGTVKAADDAYRLLRLAIAKKIPLYAVAEGTSEQLDADTKLQVLWPPKSVSNAIPLVKDQNEASVVLGIQLYGKNFLFPGDINAVTERMIVRRMEELALDKGETYLSAPIHMLKVAHHGSRFSTSEEWLQYWKPVSAVASASATNSYGHPHPDVLERLKKAETYIKRTDRDGEVTFRVTKRELHLRE